MIKTEIDSMVAMWGVVFVTPSSQTIMAAAAEDMDAEGDLAKKLSRVQPRIQLQLMDSKLNIMATQMFNPDELSHFLVSARAVQQKAREMGVLVDSGFDKYREMARQKGNREPE